MAKETSVKKAQKYHSMCLMHLSDNCMTGEELINILMRLGNYNTTVTGWKRKLWGLALWKVARIKAELSCSLTQFEEDVIGIRRHIGMTGGRMSHDEWVKMMERLKAKRAGIGEMLSKRVDIYGELSS